MGSVLSVALFMHVNMCMHFKDVKMSRFVSAIFCLYGMMGTENRWNY